MGRHRVGLLGHRIGGQDLVEGLSFAETVVSQANSVIVIVDQHGRVQRFNKLSEEYTGKREQDIVGRSVFDMFMTRGGLGLAATSPPSTATASPTSRAPDQHGQGPEAVLFRNKFVTSGSGESASI